MFNHDTRGNGKPGASHLDGLAYHGQELKRVTTPPLAARDIYLPLFILQIPQKTLARYDLTPRDWLELLGSLADIDLNEDNLATTFVSLNAFREIMGYGRAVFGPEKFLRLYLEDITPAHLGPAGMAMATAPTVGDGLNQWISCGRYILPLLTVRRHYTEQYFYTTNELNADLGAGAVPFMELILLLTARLIQEISDGQAHVGVHFAHQQRLPTAFYEAHIGITPVFGAETNSIILAHADLDIPNGNYAPIAHQHALMSLRDVAQMAAGHESLRQRVRLMLIDGGSRGEFYTLEAVANRLHLSGRTLARRLAEENTHFRELQCEARIEVAKQLLRQPGTPIKSVYERAGFNDLSAFSRAFRRYARLSPKEYQEQQGLRI